MGVVSLSPTTPPTSAASIMLFQSQQQSPPPPPPPLLRLRGVFSSATRGTEGGGRGGAFSISTWARICFPQRRQLLLFRVKSVDSSSTVDGLQNFMGKLQNPSDEEREDHRHSLNDVTENFPNPPEDSLDDVVESFLNSSEEKQKRPISKASRTKLPFEFKKLKAMARMTEIGTDGQLHPTTLYLIDMGLDMNQIKQMARRFPVITSPCWRKYARSLAEFLLDLGLPPSDIRTILFKNPSLCGLSLSENIIPSMKYLETLGVDKSKWAKVIKRFPNLLACSKQKVEATVEYFYELGLSRDRIGKVLTQFPAIVGSSVDDNLRLKAEYFRAMGVNPTSLLSHYPTIFGRSIECQLKPVTKFLLDKGFSIDEIGTMVSRYGAIYSLSLTKNLIPKWDFFLTIDYPRSELVKNPNYFGYSLEGRIKPRYSQMSECGVKLSLSYLLGQSDSKFEKFLNRSMKNGLVAQHDSIHVTSADD